MERVRRGRGRPRGEPRGGGRAGRRGGGQQRDRLRHRHASYGAQLVVEAEDRDDRGASWPRPSSSRAAARAGPAVVADRPSRALAIRRRRRRTGRVRMIRLGSLAGYPFEGPRVLGGWTPPAEPRGVRDRVQAGARDQARHVRGDLRRPRRRPVRRAASRSTTPARDAGSGGRAAAGSSTSAPTRCPAGCPRTGSRSPRSSVAIYHPSCNEQQYDRSWKDEWIGEYTAPTTGPLTTEPRPRTSADARWLAGDAVPAIAPRAPPVRADRAVADAVMQPRAAPPGGRLGRSSLDRLRRAAASRRPRSPRPCRRAAAARRRRPRRCG